MDAIDLLIKQHDETKAALKKASKGKLGAAELRRMADELVAHMVIEEHVFYPRIRELDKDLVKESFEEHAVARFELARALIAEGEEQEVRLGVLKELIEHHIKEEQEELFPKVRRGIPKAELEGQIGDTTVGLQARLMSQAMRKLAGNLNRTNTVCLFTNQIREKVGVQFGSPETQPGGRALKFYASQRLDIRRIETLKEGTEAVGNRVRVKVVKNKVASPFRQAEFDIEYGVGISREGGLLDFGMEHDLVQKSGSFFSYGETRLGQGRNNAKQFLADNPELAAEIEGKVRAALGLGAEGAAEPARESALAAEPEVAEAKAA